MPVAIIVAGAAGFIVSRPILHLRGDYLAIVTIAFGEILRMLLVNNVGGVTGGANGLFGIDSIEIFGYSFDSVLSNYYLVLFFIVITIFAVNRLENSRLGRAWMYVREDQTAAEAMGINTVQVKAIAFVLGSAWAGLAGVLYASRIGSISPDLGSFLESVIMFSIVVLGGVGLHPRRHRRRHRHDRAARALPVRQGLARWFRGPGDGSDDDLPACRSLAQPAAS